MILLNFSHPVAADGLDRIAAATGQPVERVVDVPVHFDGERPFAGQVGELVGGIGLGRAEWQTLPLLVNPPAFAPIAAVLLAHLHGLIGHFPPVVRIRPVVGAVSARFEVAEVIDLNTLRDAARRARSPEEGVEG